MKIATWNLMRPNSKSVIRNAVYADTLNTIDPDIIILTETNSLISFGNKYFITTTEPLPKIHDDYEYADGENRVTILSKFPFARKFLTADKYTSVCAETSTPFGNLIVYGTIIGFLGGKHESFESDFEKQISDLDEISQHGNLCLGGDMNISFSGYTYPSHIVREKTKKIFERLSLTNLTGHFENCVLHTIISNKFLLNKKATAERLAFDKKITDHSLLTVSLSSFL